MATTNPATDREVYEQYPALLDQLVAFVRPLMLLPLQEMAAANERMQALGPILTPTAYQRGAQNLTDQRRLIEAAAALQRVVRSFPGGAER